jgi:hypothetical protein
MQIPKLPRRDEDVCPAPFRWDQRMYTIVVSPTGSPSLQPQQLVPKLLAMMTGSSHDPVTSLAVHSSRACFVDATGGMYWGGRCLDELMKAVDGTSARIQARPRPA